MANFVRLKGQIVNTESISMIYNIQERRTNDGTSRTSSVVCFIGSRDYIEISEEDYHRLLDAIHLSEVEVTA